jgi:hypothetical protein
MAHVLDKNSVRKIVQADHEDLRRMGEFDSMFQIPIYIDVVHHEIHEGAAFTYCYSGSMAGTSGTLSLSFLVPATKPHIHLVCDWSSAAEATFKITKGASASGGSDVASTLAGAASSTANRITKDVTLAGSPTTIREEISGVGKNQGGRASSRGESEYILESAKIYSFILANNSSSTAIGTIYLEWYEHEDE